MREQLPRILRAGSGLIMDARTEERRARLRFELMEAADMLGFPEELGASVARELGTEWAMERMLGYLRRVRPGSAEEIADEMLAIIATRDAWRGKKIAEYYNAKMNGLMREGPWEEEDDADVQERR
jgi:hypothetical protein